MEPYINPYLPADRQRADEVPPEYENQNEDEKDWEEDDWDEDEVDV